MINESICSLSCVVCCAAICCHRPLLLFLQNLSYHSHDLHEEDEDDAECCCGSREYDIILRYSLSEFPPLTSTANIQSYESHFPAGLAPKPGFIWDSSEYGVEQLYSWSSIPSNFVVHKLPKIKILKRKEL
jgi:hypothetical protein